VERRDVNMRPSLAAAVGPASTVTRPRHGIAALMRIWLGPNPADAGLKEALLGREARPVGSGPAN
jgi:hypothetical protein